MLNKLRKLLKDDSAPTAVEYALMVAGIAVVVIAAVFLLGGNTSKALNKVATEIGTKVP
jgi:pilus assembly protein Flp/PilA